jgi:hypothetical protein
MDALGPARSLVPERSSDGLHAARGHQFRDLRQLFRVEGWAPMTNPRKSYSIEGEMTIFGPGKIIEFSNGENTLTVEEWLAAAFDFVMDGETENYGQVRMTVEQVR